ncbi:uncharacterized protein LOC125495046 [Beta vulgaris subsp. vulgaris]|uniref:uncharacterized protein LOC125495046 n=1 Tax=Beta vulgaris subsp. vulgaris TaxID=3555 RepID=UPI0025487C59|nr:uncharacterized protein LOC125495046 [Beta vulgaris subsp. vulgaris]
MAKPFDALRYKLSYLSLLNFAELLIETGTPQTQCPAFPPPEESPKQPENNAAPGDDNRREIELPQPNAPLPVNQAPVQDPAPPIQGPAPMGGPAPLIRGPAPIPQENPIPILFAHPSGGMATRDFNNLELIGMTTREECLPLGNIEALQPHIQALVSHHHLVTNIPFFSMLLQHDKPRYNTRYLTLPILYDRLIFLTDRIIILPPDFIRRPRL